jgi:ABC-2 type transport system permease protein
MNAPAKPLPPPDTRYQARVLARLRWRILRNALLTLSGSARVRALTILLVSAVLWGGMFALAWMGFGLLRTNDIPLAGLIIGAIFDFLFFILSLMLLFSVGILLYGNLFTSPEATFLLSTPARADRIFAYKFQEALGFASWAFALMGTPIFLVYGLMFEVPWPYYPLVIAYLLGFMLTSGSLGAIGCLLLVNLLPRRKGPLIALAVVIVVPLVLLWAARVLGALRDTFLGRDTLEGLLGQFAFAQSPFSPGHWLTEGLLASARGDYRQALWALTLLWVNGAFFYTLAAYSALHLYRRGYNRLSGSTARKRRSKPVWLDRLAGWLVCFVDRQTRLLIIKDFRTFRRDPLQWGQLLILLGLIMLYALGSPYYSRRDLGEQFRGSISLVNLGAIATLMCAYMSRFIYPLLSLEGRKFWILGLLPLERGRLIWGKFVFAATGSVLAAGGLVLLSDLLLQVGWLGTLVHLLTVLALALGLSALSVGLGALLPNFREHDPSRIAVGFGGTLFLLLGLVYLLVTTLLMAGPYHALLLLGLPLEQIARSPWVYAGPVLGLVGAGLTVRWILRLGQRAFDRLEF